jgi:hypothetical protein
MLRLLKIGAGAATAVLAVLALFAHPTVGWADSALCLPTGCPTGNQLCATVQAGIPGAGSVTFYCYQPTPGSKPPLK